MIISMNSDNDDEKHINNIINNGHKNNGCGINNNSNDIDDNSDNIDQNNAADVDN
jgi:hypothetical protein